MKKTLVLAFCLGLCLIAVGQTRHFYTSERLASNLITCICQDKAGYIWIGTEYGLNKYDGYRFTNYFHDVNNAASINSNNVTSLFVDQNGGLWVGTGIGLAYYNDANDNFERIPLANVEAARVNDIIQEDDNHLLIGTAGYGLFRLDIREKKVVQVERYATGDDDYFNHILIDDQGNFWKGGAGPVITCRLRDKTVQHFDSPYGSVTTFVPYQGGVLMVCQRGLMFYRDGQILTDFIDTSIFGGEIVQLRTALCDDKGNLFLGTLGKGLCWVPQGSHRLQRYEYASPSFDLKTTNVWALYADNQDNLWVGCLKRGLLLLPQQEPQFSSWSLSAQNVSVGGSVTSFCLGDGGITWCAVQNNGIYGFDENGKMVAHPASPPKTYSIYRDRQGAYWIGSDDGVYSYNPLTGAYSKVFTLECDYINLMTDDGQGRMFISTYSKGFTSYDVKTKAIRHFSMRDEDKVRGRLHNNWVMTMMVDSRGKLWIGTSSNLCCYDPVNDNFHPYGWEVMLEGKTIYSLYEDRDHRVLVGTDAGIFLYNQKEGKVVPLPGAEILANKVICGMIQDQYGDLWCSTSMGIWQYQRDEQRWITHVSGNGLTTREYVRGLSMQDASGSLFFGISDGITTFHPAALRDAHPTKEAVHLTGLFIGSNPVNCNTLSDGTRVMTEPLADSHHFTLSYIDNTFTMEFSLFNYANTDNVVFEYRMNGAKEWAQTNVGSNVISFNHIQPGSYTLEVRANENGVYTEPQTYYIVVRAPWYRSAWAYLIYILGAFGIIGLIGWSWKKSTTRQLDEEKMKFLINATHDIRSPLTLIMAPLSNLRRRLTDDQKDAQRDIETIELLLAHGIPEGIGNLIIPVIVILSMFFADWKLALLSIASLPIGLLAMGMMFKAGMSRMEAYYAAGAKMNNTIIEYVNGMEVVKAFNRDGESYERFERDINDYRDMTLDWYKVCWPWMALYSSIIPCVALFTLPVGGWFVLMGWSSLADYVLVLCMTFSIGVPLLKALSFAGKFPQLGYKIDELERLLDNPSIKDSGRPFEGVGHDIRFENVRFSYKEDEVIHGITLDIKEGQMVALVGESGSGKSTLAKLLVHFYDVDSGRITLGGQDLTDLRTEDLNDQISFVSQEQFLFNTSLYGNILIGKPTASREEVLHAACP